MGKPPRDGVSQCALGPASAKPRVRIGHPALEHGSIKLEPLPNGFKVE